MHFQSCDCQMAVSLFCTGNVLNSVSETKSLQKNPQHEADDTTASDASIHSESSSIIGRSKYIVCNVCCRRFASSNSLAKHLKRVHKIEPLQMSGNGIRLLNNMAACSNTEGGSGIEGKPQKAQFVCNVCGRQFRLRQLLDAHSVTHTGARPAACRYPGCGKRFGQTSTRNYHERTHSDVRPYVCSQCGQSYKQPTIFKTHVATVHGNGARPYQCSRCGKAFKLQGALHTHYKSVHMDERPHACTECTKRFKYRSQLARHKQALHLREHPWRCSICDKTFTQCGNLRTHLRSHTGEKPFSCAVCDQSFAHSGTLKGHMATHYTVNKHAAALSQTDSNKLTAFGVPFRQLLPL